LEEYWHIKIRSKERRKLWEALVNKGDFASNFMVLEKGHGCIVPKYRQSKDSTVGSLLPC
jgi:hypothetical protein